VNEIKAVWSFLKISKVTGSSTKKQARRPAPWPDWHTWWWGLCCCNVQL